jgi:hypothetical protein
MVTRSVCIAAAREGDVPDSVLEFRARRCGVEGSRAAHARRARTSLIDAEWEWLLRRAEKREANEAVESHSEPQRATLPPPPFQPELLDEAGPSSLEPLDTSSAVAVFEQGERGVFEVGSSGRSWRAGLGGLALVALLLSVWVVARAKVTPAVTAASSAPWAEQDAHSAATPPSLSPDPAASAAPTPSSSIGVRAAEVGSRGNLRKPWTPRGPRVRVSKAAVARLSRSGSDNPY